MRVRFALVPVLVLLFLAGCAAKVDPTISAITGNGLDVKSAAEILSEAEAALASVTSYRVKGIAPGGMGGPIDQVMHGADYETTMVFPGGTIHVIKIGTDYYEDDGGFMRDMLVSSGQTVPAGARYLKFDGTSPIFKLADTHDLRR